MVAKQVLHRFCLDRLYMVPSRVPPHKVPAFLAPADERVRMIQLALPADARYCLSDVELRREGRSYTIDTVDHFNTRITPGAVLFLVMGMDAFLEIHTWKSHRRLLDAVQPVVVSRRVDGRMQAGDEFGRMDGYIRSGLSGDYHYVDEQSCWQRAGKNKIHLLSTQPVDISSSQIRQRIREGKEIVDLVPPSVDAYIEQKELYR